MENRHRFGNLDLVFKKGDITKEEVDVIVNAANSAILGGGGVDGAIHRAAGPELLEECRKLRETQLPQGCPTGQAVITRAGRLKAKHVVHAVGPDMRGSPSNGAELLKAAYLNSLELAQKAGARSIAFPSISTGIYSYPIEEAAQIALNTVIEFSKRSPSPIEVRFLLFSDQDLQVYKEQALRFKG